MTNQFKECFKELETIAQRHNYEEVFRSFLIILVNYFADGQYQEKRDEAMQRYSQAEKDRFNKAFYAYFRALSDYWEADGHPSGWYDPLGEFYEEITSRYKSSAMGQFFTPASICQMITNITIPKEVKAGTCCDPAVGSGRLIIAAHANNPALTFEAADKDYICVLMCVVNMFTHGAIGTVYWADSLTLDTYYAFEIKRHPTLFVPYVVPFMPEKKAFTQFVEAAEKTPTQEKEILPQNEQIAGFEIPISQAPESKQTGQQLSLF